MLLEPLCVIEMLQNTQNINSVKQDMGEKTSSEVMWVHCIHLSGEMNGNQLDTEQQRWEPLPLNKIVSLT